jgi:hypothetical protein
MASLGLEAKALGLAEPLGQDASQTSDDVLVPLDILEGSVSEPFPRDMRIAVPAGADEPVDAAVEGEAAPGPGRAMGGCKARDAAVYAAPAFAAIIRLRCSEESAPT